MIALIGILTVEMALLVRLFSLPTVAHTGLLCGFLLAILVTQAIALRSLRRKADNTGLETGAVGFSAMIYAGVFAVTGWQPSPHMDVLLAAGFLLFLAPLSMDPTLFPIAASKQRRTAAAPQDLRVTLLSGVAAASLTVSLAGAPLLHATAGGARDLFPAILNALRRSTPAPLPGDDASASAAAGSALRYGIDADTVHKVHAGIQDREPHAPVLYIQPTGLRSLPLRATRRFYVRVMTYDAYTDGYWITRTRTQKLLKDEDDGAADGRISFSATSGNPEPYAVYAPPLANGVLPTLPRVTAIYLPRVVQMPNDILASPVVTKADWLNYFAESAPLCWDDVTSARVAPARDATFVWMQTGRLSVRIRAEALRVVPRGRADPDSVAKVLALLRNTCAYSTAEQAQAGVPPLESFLFSTRKGHCELYATACALMLRSLGIPCRFSIGYCGGTYDPARRLYALYADEAHAWVEVLLDTHGWVVLDPTPETVAGTPAPPAKGKIDADLESIVGADLADIVARTKLSADAIKPPSAGESFVLSDIARAALWCALLVAAVLLAVSLRTLRRRRNRAIAAAERHRQVRTGLAFFDAFCRHFARRGAAMRQHETPLEYLARLKRAGLVGDAFDEAVAYFCRICFGESQRDTDREETFLRQMREPMAPSCR